MSHILYYSNYCNNCKNLLQNLAKNYNSKEIHFICVDKRLKEKEGTYLLLEKGEKVILPPTVTNVPALLLLNRGHRVVFGNEIMDHLVPKEGQHYNQGNNNQGNNNQGPNNIMNSHTEPQAFGFAGNQYGVCSDSFSFWDLNESDLSTKGEGGMRQLYNYATINWNDTIETPTDDYSPDKVGDVSLEKLQQERNKDLPSFR